MDSIDSREVLYYDDTGYGLCEFNCTLYRHPLEKPTVQCHIFI